MIRRNSHLTRPLNFALTSLVETGIVGKLRRDAIERGPKDDQEGSNTDNVTKLRLDDVFVQFAVLGVGLAISAVAFVLEMFCYVVKLCCYQKNQVH